MRRSLRLEEIVLVGLLLGAGAIPAKGLGECRGDCDGSGDVTINEIVTLVNVALGSAPATACRSGAPEGIPIDVVLIIQAVNAALVGCPASGSTSTPTPSPTPTVAATAAGSYSSTIPLSNGEIAHLNVSVQAGGSASGTFEIVGPSPSAPTEFRTDQLANSIGVAVSLGFASLAGSVDPSTGSFHFAGSMTISGQTTSFDLSGSLPLYPGGIGAVSAVINGQTYSSTIGMGAGPTPLPTQGSVPTSTPGGGGCGNAMWDATYSGASGTNATTSPAHFGKITASEQADGPGHWAWTLKAEPCAPGFGLQRALLLTASAQAPIGPGTYALNACGSVACTYLYYTEANVSLNPAEAFTRTWLVSGGSLTITSGPNGTLAVDLAAATMVPYPVTPSALGTFTLDVNGTIDSVSQQ